MTITALATPDPDFPGDTADDILFTLQGVLIQLESMATTLVNAVAKLLEIEVEVTE